MIHPTGCLLNVYQELGFPVNQGLMGNIQSWGQVIWQLAWQKLSNKRFPKTKTI